MSNVSSKIILEKICITFTVISIPTKTQAAFAAMASGTRINTAGVLVAFMLMCITQIDRKTGGVRGIHLEAQFTITGVSSLQVYAPSMLKSTVMSMWTADRFAFVNIITVSSVSLKALVTVAGIVEYTILALCPGMTVVTSGTEVKLSANWTALPFLDNSLV
jgi:hypothetical protein